MGLNVEVIKKKVISTASKISKNKYLSSISEALTSVMPVLMLGSFATLFANLNIDSYQNFIQRTGLKQVFQIPGSVLITLLSIYAVFFIAYRLVSNLNPKADNAGAGLIALMSFFILTPITKVDEVNAFTFNYLGAQGLFVAIIVGLVVGKLYVMIINRNLIIKMPKGVPPTVAKTFANLIPGTIIVIVFTMISYLSSLTDFGSLHQMIYTSIQAPLQNIGGGYWSLVIFVFVVQLLWFFGIHGFMVVSPIFYSVWLPLGLANLDAISRGEAHTNILSGGFYNSFVVIGGSGATLGLAILLAFFAKSKRYKTLGRLAFPASIFSINEPIIFGIPLVLNPFMFIPFVFGPIIVSSFAYWSMNLGIFPIANGTHFPAGTPIILNSFVNGGIRLVVLQLMCIALQVIIYYPFFRIIDKKSIEDEQNAITQGADNVTV
ncbi:PTS sugar transporter subunit IIC [Paenibacillus sp. NRS-1782]|uniref:PTS sugar transporter subunit IIC n=1 Tax=unclassified Paenibacillus TaxID=185978 RepID=UPI003D2ABAE0